MENERYGFPAFETTGEESDDPEVIQHIKPENRTAQERDILTRWVKAKKAEK